MLKRPNSVIPKNTVTFAPATMGGAVGKGKLLLSFIVPLQLRIAKEHLSKATVLEVALEFPQADFADLANFSGCLGGQVRVSYFAATLLHVVPTFYFAF